MKDERKASGSVVTQDALLLEVLLAPTRDEPRLAYADWLREHGHGERAEFINLQCRLARCRTFPDHRKGKICLCEGCRMRERIGQLLVPETAAEWGDAEGLKAAGLTVPARTVNYQEPHVPGTLGLQWSRGFPVWTHAPFAVFLSIDKALFRRHPITRVTLDDAARHVETETRSTGDRHFWLNAPGRKIWLGCRESKDTPPTASNDVFNRWLAEAISKACVMRGRKLAGLGRG